MSYTLTSFQIFLQVLGQLVVVHLLQDGQHVVPSSRAVHLHQQVHSVISVGLLQFSPWDFVILVPKAVLGRLEIGIREVAQSVPQHSLHFPQGCGKERQKEVREKEESEIK